MTFQVLPNKLGITSSIPKWAFYGLKGAGELVVGHLLPLNACLTTLIQTLQRIFCTSFIVAGTIRLRYSCNSLECVLVATVLTLVFTQGALVKQMLVKLPSFHLLLTLVGTEQCHTFTGLKVGLQTPQLSNPFTPGSPVDTVDFKLIDLMFNRSIINILKCFPFSMANWTAFRFVFI